jgi:hypothetical protein
MKKKKRMNTTAIKHFEREDQSQFQATILTSAWRGGKPGKNLSA